uniref:Cysteine-rich protein n=1 Tax=Phytophthora infestans TaxID=4787 RepID=Q2M434_PHYIN|nr:cysteine-rich protein [Phytophthora infestans]
MVKFSVSLLLAALMAAPALAGYSPESGGYTPTTSEPTSEDGATCDQNPAMPDTCDGSDGWYPVSVVGKEGYFCAQGPICTSEVGNCPGVHGDLTFGSSCVSISEGVYGCVPNTECPTTESTPVHDECEVSTDTPTTAPRSPLRQSPGLPLFRRPSHP